MKNPLPIIIVGLGISVCHGQSLSPEVVAPAGGTDKNAKVQVEYTVGQSAVETKQVDSKIYTQGFHQPALRVDGVEATNELLNADYHIVVAPNPVTTSLSIN